MNSEPRLPKLPFIIGDIVLVATALIVGKLTDHFISSEIVVIVACCVAAGAALLVAPFIADYTAQIRESVRHAREKLEQQAKHTNTVTENLGRTVAQIKAIEEAVHKSARDAETLPYRIKEKLSEFNEALVEKEEAERESLEDELNKLRATNAAQLQATADKVQKLTADWATLERASRNQLAAAQDAASHFGRQAHEMASQLEAQFAELDRLWRTLTAAGAALPTPAQAEPAIATPAPKLAAMELPTSDVGPETKLPLSDITNLTEPLEQQKLCASRKPSSEEPPASENKKIALDPEPSSQPTTPKAEVAVSLSAPTPELTTAPPSAAPDKALADPKSVGSKAVSSSDGTTRLLVTAYIGIGNKLFIRGDGLGLSWNKGAPMQFVSIGKWGWATHEANGPFRVRLYKNDKLASLGGEIILVPGHQTAVTALF